MAVTGVTWQQPPAQLGVVIQTLGTNAPKAVMAAIVECANEILTETLPITPVDTGALRGSGVVQVSGMTVTIGFGGPAAPYAFEVHEDMSAKHQAPTQAKFLETTFNKYTASLDARIAAKVGSMSNAPTVSPMASSGGGGSRKR